MRETHQGSFHSFGFCSAIIFKFMLNHKLLSPDFFCSYSLNSVLIGLFNKVNCFLLFAGYPILFNVVMNILTLCAFNISDRI